eukprot:GFUD01104489.1.p1 GENE.GFUD01104489.1~~GFUD01104489.1.p1  ORF type:complete len:238 (+),score=54.01 GFUD01104489.1:49-762(+)
MNSSSYQDFLSCIYIAAKELNSQREDIIEGLMMVYSGETPANMPRLEMITRTAQGVKLLGAGVVKVVHRCKDAQDPQLLDLSLCSLLKVPDAVFYLVRASKVLTCNISGNLLTKISPKFGTCFKHLTTLNLSTNRLSTLPSELVYCTKLQSIDISINSFVVFPTILLVIESVTEIRAKNNFIADVDDQALEQHANLELVNLEENPLDSMTHARLSRVERLTIVLTDRGVQEWEDLSI